MKTNSWFEIYRNNRSKYSKLNNFLEILTTIAIMASIYLILKPGSSLLGTLDYLVFPILFIVNLIVFILDIRGRKRNFEA
jgi:hypothetical protein